MIVQPKIRGFICTTAHPVGCLRQVQGQIDYVRAQVPLKNVPQRALILGASTGYGLSSRIALAFGAHTETIGISFERPAKLPDRTASAGWYNSWAFEREAQSEGIKFYNINGDAFSSKTKAATVEILKQRGPIDLLIYSLATPRRFEEKTNTTHVSVLKPTGQDYRSLSLDAAKKQLTEVNLSAATEEEIAATVKVMGGEDWAEWVERLQAENLLQPGFKTLAYSYIGPELTWPIYTNGTIGRAKADLEKTAQILSKKLESIRGKALIAVNKAIVTQASSAIPVVPLYLCLLFKLMKRKGLHEGSIQQMMRLFAEKWTGPDCVVDDKGRIRLDDWEMKPEIQDEVKRIWGLLGDSNWAPYADIEQYENDFLHLFGFGMPKVDYTADVDIDVHFDPKVFLNLIED